MINGQHKDRLFCFIFGREENRAWTLSLYNAVQGTSYTDAEDIEITTMGDVVYMGMKNDVSFLLQWRMSIWEHQASVNLNMPVRELMYAGKLYDKYIHQKGLNIYGSKRLTLPVPKLVVFYNGTAEQEDEVILQLSDSFPQELAGESDINVRVRMLNVNSGRNKQLMAACKVLAEYAWLVEKIRELSRQMIIDEAVDQALDEMPLDYEIREFLLNNRVEVRGMCLTEYNEEEVMEMFRREAREEGIEEGREEGATLLGRLIKQLLAAGRTDDVNRACDDEKTRAQLYKEFGLA